MDVFIGSCWLSLLIFASFATANENINETSSILREPRVNGRIVVVYSGHRPDPFLCTSEGFKPDVNNCAVFYRCVKEKSGKFTVFRYQCAPGTVFDPDVDTCNHARSTRRAECGGIARPSDPQKHPNVNEIQDYNKEIPRPFVPQPITEKTTPVTTTVPHWVFSTNKEIVTITTKYTEDNHYNYQHSTDHTTQYPWTSPSNSYLSHVSKEPSITRTTTQSNSGKNVICESDGFTGDYDNCRKFYRCVGNQRGGFVKYEFYCSELTVWDDELQSCNHPWAVKRSKCGRSLSYKEATNTEQYMFDTTTVKQNTKPTFGDKLQKTSQQQLQINYGNEVTQTQTQISHSDQVMQNQTQINYGDRINKEVDGKQNQTQISYGSAVSQSQTQIDYGNKGVQTQLQIDHSKDSSQSQTQIHDSTTQGSLTTQLDSSSDKCSENGFMGDRNNCKKFYRCVDNGRGTFTRYEYLCGDGTVWDPTIESCNHQWAVKGCGGSSEPHEEKQTTTIKSTYPTEATKTTQSYHTTQVISSTEDPDDIDVGYGNQENEVVSTTLSTTTKSSTTTSSIVNECSSNGFMGDANDCKKFYRCVDNGRGFTKHEFKCGDGTVWDPEIEACNHVWAVKQCGGSTTSSQMETTTKGDISTIMPGVQTTVTLVQTTTQNSTPDEDYDGGYNKPTSDKPYTTSNQLTTKSEPNKDNECKKSGFMGDINDCKKFYRCVDNGNGGYTRYEFTCGEGTVWDPEIEACNHAWAVEKCGGSNTGVDESSNVQPDQTTVISQITTTQISPTDNQQTTSSITSSGPSTTSTSASSSTGNKCRNSGFMGDENDCKKFYRCVDNGDGTYTKYEFTCGEGTVWDPEIEACNHAWAVEHCGGNKESSSEQSFSSTSQFPIMNEEDSAIATTEHSDAIHSTQGSTSSGTSISSIESNESNECRGNGFYGDKSDCKKFYRCVDNGNGGYDRYEFYCGEGTVWDEEISSCNHASAVKSCGSSHTTSKKPEYTSTESSGTTSDSENLTQGSTEKTSTTIKQSNEISDEECTTAGFFGDKNNCKKFYRCVDNGKGGYTKYEFVCGDGTSWNQDIQACDHESDKNMCLSSGSATSSPVDVTTISTNTSTVEHQTTEAHETSIPNESSKDCKSEGFFPHPIDCKKFVRCVSNGDGKFTRYEFTCGEGTVWSQDIQACDHDNGQKDCKSNQPTEKPQPQESSTASAYPDNTKEPSKEEDEYQTESPSQSDSGECTSEGYYGDKNDCRKFYRCVDNGNGSYTKYEFVCGEGTAWDPDIQNCNHISEVSSCTNQDNQNQNPSTGEEETQTIDSSSSTQTETTSQKPEHTSSESSESSSEAEDDVCDEEGYFGNSKDCKKFYRCVDDGKGGYTKYDFTCADGTIWDQDITNCNHPQDVANPSCSSDGDTSSSSDGSNTSSTSSTTSSSGTASSTIESSTQSSSNCSQEDSSKKPNDNKNITCEKAGYYANPNDCKKFYRCVDWDGDGKKFSVFHFECGEGTIWDPALDTCNHEESVYPPRDCSRSQSQSETTTEQSKEDSTTEQSTTQESTTAEQTTTQETTTSEPTTTEQQTTSETTTTQESTTSEQTTTQKTTTSQQTTTQESTTQEQTTTQESTTQEQTTTQQSTTSEQTTTQESTTSEQTTTQQTTTQESTTSEQTTTQQTTTQESTTSEQSTTEQTTESTTTTEQNTNESTQQTTESSTTQESTTQTTESSTTDQTGPTTESSTEEQTNGTTEETTESTTEGSSTTTESGNESTTESSKDSKCPETEDDQYVLVCPTSFKRHPKYCNMFYQCTEDDDTHEVKVATFKCPNETIYDESQTQCVEKKDADKKCEGEMARRVRFKRLSSKEPIIVDKEKKSCRAAGYYSFENQTECSPAFLRCAKTKSGKLRGFVNQCPKGYIFWNISKRCERIENVKDCKRSSVDWKGRWNIPVDRKNIAV